MTRAAYFAGLAFMVLFLYQFVAVDLYRRIVPASTAVPGLTSPVHLGISFGIAVILASGLGLWGRSVPITGKVIALLSCLVIPLVDVWLHDTFACYVQRACF